MRRRAVLGLTMMVGLIGAAPAMAQSPAGCQANRFQADPFKDRTFIRDGETVNYTVHVYNDLPGSCDAANVSLRFQVPGQDGNPSPAFLTLLTGGNFSAGSHEQVYGPFSFTANFGPTPPDRYFARVTTPAGVVYDVPAPGSPLTIDRYLQLLTVRPGLSITKTGSTTGGPAPQNVVYTYQVKNQTLPAGLPNDVSQMQNIVPTDDLCSPLNLVSGDTNGDGKMQVTETWTYTCGQTFTNPGTYTNTVKVCGDEVADNIPKNYCSPPATWTVNVTPPGGNNPPANTPPAATPPAPQGQVLPVSQAAPKCTLSTPTGLKVRAKETTTIKVTVRNVDAGSTVRITLPGGKVVSAKTNAKGLAILKVKPTRTGRATIKVADCSDIERLTVRAARKTASRQVPKVTG